MIDRAGVAAPVLSMRGICKRFDDRLVLDHAGLEVAAGEVHALLGENGAGKSTLMNILTGVYTADTGDIHVGGARAAIRGPRDARAAGIGMVHQHFRLVDRFTVTENILLAADGQIGLRRASEAAAALAVTSAELGFAVDPTARIADLSVAERQRVEICRVLLLGARIVVLDEPTAVLTDREATSLLAAIRRLADAGRSVVLITHKLREVAGHSDRVTIMRQGKTVSASLDAKGLNADDLARRMVGEITPPERRAVVSAPGPDRLIATDLTVARPDGGVGIDGVSLRVRAGEILGVAGIGGNGQQQLADAVTGLAAVTRGSVSIDGTTVLPGGVAARRALGLRVIPSDRMASGLIGDLDVADNLALTRVARGRYGVAWLQRGRMRQDAAEAIADHGIAGATPTRKTRLLSGGNAQKLLLARELADGVAVLVAHSPTRGLDVKACAFVQQLIRRAVDGGAACLLISEDLEEVLALSDRIAVMSRGRIVGECTAGSSARDVGALMLD
ncbi:MAG: ABC transporter ATP-binding protein [Burkholderiales bacterium]|nr:ABC transporter ATP-binding protein [Burkholderiales bacterium]